MTERPDIGVKVCEASEGDQTSRGIKIGSTLEELKEVYGDVWGSVTTEEYDDIEKGRFSYIFHKDETMSLSFLVADETVRSMFVFVYTPR